MLTSLPNLLTLSRIIVIPIIIGLFFVREPWAAWTACVLFSAAAITDYVDGYLARSWSQVSIVGKFLDPIADKLLVAAVLFMLVAVDKLNGISVLPAVVILLREVLVSGLREFLAGIRVGMPVSKLAKWKTAIQMVALAILIVGNDGPPWLPVEAIGVVGLWAAGLLTLITGWDYMQAGWKHMNEEREPEPEPTPHPAQPHGTGAARSVG
jgi:cardiolipin synthase (CMP-forming)